MAGPGSVSRSGRMSPAVPTMVIQPFCRKRLPRRRPIQSSRAATSRMKIVLAPQAAANTIFMREVAARERLADDGHLGRVPGIGVAEIASSQERNSHGAEIIGTDYVPRGRDLPVRVGHS